MKCGERAFRGRMSEVRAQVIALTVFVLTLMGCSGGSADHRRARCESLRDHIVEIRLAGASKNAEPHRNAMKQALGEDFLTECSRMDDQVIACGLAARDNASVLKCVSPTKGEAQSK